MDSKLAWRQSSERWTTRQRRIDRFRRSYSNKSVAYTAANTERMVQRDGVSKDFNDKLLIRSHLRRRTEDIAFWRKRAGWYDDDQSMREYNSGVYDAYYQADDDGSYYLQSNESNGQVSTNSNTAATVFKFVAFAVVTGFFAMLIRAIGRRARKEAPKNADRKERRRSNSKDPSLSRSLSRSRSRSRSRCRNDAYDLMTDADDVSRSKRSSRSKTRRPSTGRSTSRTRTPSRTPRVDNEVKIHEPILV